MLAGGVEPLPSPLATSKTDSRTVFAASDRNLFDSISQLYALQANDGSKPLHRAKAAQWSEHGGPAKPKSKQWTTPTAWIFLKPACELLPLAPHGQFLRPLTLLEATVARAARSLL